MTKKYEYNNIPSDMAAEPVVNTHGIVTNVLSIGIPQKDMAIAREMINRMGWIVYTYPQTKSDKKQNDLLHNAIANLKGCISLPNNFDYKKDIAEYLEAKYK